MKNTKLFRSVKKKIKNINSFLQLGKARDLIFGVERNSDHVHENQTMRWERTLASPRNLMRLTLCITILFLFLWNVLINLIMRIPHVLTRFAGGESVRQSTIRLFLPRLDVPFLSLIGIILVIVLNLYIVFKIRNAYGENINQGQKGVSRFTTEEEIIAEYKEIDPVDTPIPGHGGIVVSRIKDKLYIDDSIVNNLILGITRSGKDQMLVFTTIENCSRAEIQPSMIITDMKLSTYKATKEELERRGYDVYLLNLADPSKSMGFNMLSVVIEYWKKRDYDMAEQVLNSLAYSLYDVKGAQGEMGFFTPAGASLFSAMVLATVSDAIQADEEENQVRYNRWRKLSFEQRENHPFIPSNENEKTININSMLITFGTLVATSISKDGSKTKLDEYFNSRAPHDRARMKYLLTSVSPDRTKSGIFAEMLRHLDSFNTPMVAKMFAESSLDLEELGFGKRPIAVFIGVPDYDLSLYKIPTVFIRQVDFVNGKRASMGKGTFERPIRVIFNEAGNFPAVENFSTMITMGLEKGLSIDTYIQEYAQLTERYGEHNAEVIESNCGNHIYILARSESTRNKFSSFLGKSSFTDVTRSGGKFAIDKTVNESVTDRPLLFPNDLKELQMGEYVIDRVSKRLDNDGNKIKARPIFNTINNGRDLRYAHEFLYEVFKDPHTVNLHEICTESRTHINVQDRIWDVEKSWDMIRKKKVNIQRLGGCDFDLIHQLLTKHLGNNYQAEHGISRETPFAEFTAFIHRTSMPQNDKSTILRYLESGMSAFQQKLHFEMGD